MIPLNYLITGTEKNDVNDGFVDWIEKLVNRILNTMSEDETEELKDRIETDKILCSLIRSHIETVLTWCNDIVEKETNLSLDDVRVYKSMWGNYYDFYYKIHRCIVENLLSMNVEDIRNFEEVGKVEDIEKNEDANCDDDERYKFLVKGTFEYPTKRPMNYNYLADNPSYLVCFYTALKNDCERTQTGLKIFGGKPIRQDKKSGLNDVFTDRARKYFERAEKAGYLRKSEQAEYLSLGKYDKTRYEWLFVDGGKGEKPNRMALGYFVKKIYITNENDTKQHIPFKHLGVVFGVPRLDGYVSKLLVSKPQQWQKKIDRLFEN